MLDDFGIRYINTGDWVESCTAVVEHWDGGLRSCVGGMRRGTAKHNGMTGRASWR
jgi:hypothetical protein